MRLLAAAAAIGVASAYTVKSPASGAAKTENAGVYYTAAQDVKIEGLTANKPCMGDSATFTKVVNGAGVDVSAKVLATSPNATDGNCTYNFGLLPDDVYTFVGTESVKVQLDNTAPVVTAYVAPGQFFAGQTNQKIAIPTSVFSDNLDGAANLQITSTAAGGFSVDPSPSMLDVAVLKAATVGAAGPQTVTLTATDRAGNTATTTVKFTIAADSAKPKPALLVSDSRGGSSGAASGAWFTKDSETVNVTLNFADEMVPGTVSFGAATVTADAANPKSGRSFKYTLTGTLTPIQLTAGSFTRKSDSTPNQASESMTVTVVAAADKMVAGAAETAVYGAAVTRDFFHYVPAGIFTNIKGGLTISSATSPQAGVGLYLQPGKLGRAAIVGKATVLPGAATAPCAASQVKFDITGTDGAGNTATGTLCVPVKALPAVNTVTGLTSTALAADEATAVKLFGTTAVTLNDLILDLDTAENTTDTKACTSGTDCLNSVVAYLESPVKVDTLANDATKEYLSSSADIKSTSVGAADSAYEFAPLFKLAHADLGMLNSAAVKAALEAIEYKNENEAAVSTDVVNKRMARVMVIADGVLLGYTAKAVNYKVYNDKPVISLETGLSSVTTAETGTQEWKLFSTDGGDGVDINDDDDAGMRSAIVAITDGCIKAKDRLALATGYSDANGLIANYDMASCRMTVSPAAGNPTMTKADLETLLNNVVFKSATPTNPNAARDATEARIINLFVTDNASGNNVAAPAVTKSADITLNVVSVNTLPTLDPAKAYGPGGIFFAADKFANKLTTASQLQTGYAKFVAIKPYSGKTTKVPLAFNFNKVSDGMYAGGAIQYSDLGSAANGIAAGDVGVSIKTLDGTTYTDVTEKVTLWSNKNSAAATALEVVGTSSPALWGVELRVADDATAGEYLIQFSYDGATFDNFFDVRTPACFLSLADATAAATAAVTEYPDNTRCMATTQSIAMSAGGTASLGKSPAAIAAMKLAGSVANLANNRNLFRGSVNVVVPAKALATSATSVDFRITPVAAAAAARLPVAPATGATVDTAVAVKLGPAGSTFTTPVKVCAMIGTVDTSVTRPVLAVASQIDSNDETKGYKAWETLAEQSFDELTGELCGTTTHFSVAAPILVPVPATPTQQKTYQMGASCPNACSGKGYCREHGQCVCFNGFTGYDCGQRTCPAEESWDVPADGSVAHKPAECSGRGACDRKAGTCVCYPGFEGSSCDRVSCPSGCSGHGRCVLAKELSNVGTYTAWEADRVQVCACDAGYTGPDCAQRQCPFGDDPETVCTDDNKQIQTVTIDFGTLPGTAAAFSHLYDNDELSLTFTTKDARSFSTPTVGGIWEGTATVTDALQKALTSLPNFAVSDVSVSSTVDATKVKVSYDVTFTGSSLVFNLLNSNNFGAKAASAVAGNTVSGDQNLLTCSQVGGFLTGCSGAGCRPKQKQPRLLEIQTTGTTFASINENAILLQDEKSKSEAASFTTSGVWGVSVAVTVKTVGGKSTYSYSVSTYGESLKTSDEIPLPPDALRKNVAISHGLFLDFNTGSYAGAGSTMVFNWRLPKCDVSVKQPASTMYEVSECSSRGTCDRKSGQCQCYAGYAGYNCGQQTVIV